MPAFHTLDAAIAMVLLYLQLSLICSAIKECVEAGLKKRSKALEEGIVQLLGHDMAQKLYEHGLVSGLADGDAKPHYIPSHIFSAALQDLLRNAIPAPDKLAQAICALDSQGPGAIERWFDAAMDAVSGAYKRHTQWWLALIGLGATVSMNADSVSMAAGSPIGWTDPFTWHESARVLAKHGIGWLITVAAILIGAPFWYDVLGRLVQVRAAVRPDKLNTGPT